ncbi:DUF1800 family protein [Marinicella sp. W31]|uniref:DUF1800 domain-containing protein n=1 Tax=Marinicella sp. W31 TaxID=3023713 RepID=UPI0037568625
MKKHTVILGILLSLQTIACEDVIFRNSLEPAVLTESEASRFLMQASFGPNTSSIHKLRFEGFENWIDRHTCMPASFITEDLLALPEGSSLLTQRLRLNWQSYVNAPDQLRQRVAYALSQIFVVSQRGYQCGACPIGIGRYHDTLLEHGLGNFRDLLEAVTLNPVMGFYLSMLGNARADELANTRADENFAREIMQLFSIGLVMLNQDGSEQLNGLEPIATYNIEHIKELAKVLTGWNWAGTPSWLFPAANQLEPMTVYRENGDAIYHDFSAKAIIGHAGESSATMVDAGLSPEADLAFALDTIFNHPNVAPFISKQLIQMLVTSNPSAEYIGRVSAVFNDDGNGVRGDMAAVVQAVLLDVEARSELVAQEDGYGQLREPILRLTHLWRALDAEFDVGGASDNFIFLGLQLGQSPYQAPSVFNFFRPDYQSNFIEPETLVAPVFQINTESNLVTYQNLLAGIVLNGFSGGAQLSFFHVIMDGERIRNWLLVSNQTLIDNVNILFFGGNMSVALNGTLNDLLNNLANDFGAPDQLSQEALTTRAALLIYVALTTAEYLIQK